MQQSISTVLFPEYRRRVMALLLLNPEQALHGREIARQTGLSAGAVSRELGHLADAGLLRREKRGNQQLYSADTSCPVFMELASILRKTSGMADVLRMALAPVSDKLRAAFIFGSVAQGRETASSDVDIMLIGDVGFADAVELSYPAQTQLGREINPRVFTLAEFAAKASVEPYLRDVLTKPKIFLIGDEDDLAQLAGDQS